MGEHVLAQTIQYPRKAKHKMTKKDRIFYIHIHILWEKYKIIGEKVARRVPKYANIGE